MPYKIIQFPNGKYKVYSERSKKFMSNKYLTYEHAVKQLRALYLHEKGIEAMRKFLDRI